jgi:hypothetical protein
MLQAFMPAINNMAGGVGKGLGEAIGGGGGPLFSGGGSTDARSFMDGSGWTVSIGSAKAMGGARTGGPELGAMPAGSAFAQPQQAGMQWLMLLAFGGALFFAVRK